MNGKILITGAAGFIGRAVAERLFSEGADLVLVDSLNNYYSPQLKRDRLSTLLNGGKIKFFYADITNKDYLDRLFKENEIETVIHLAAQPGVSASMIDPGKTFRNNVEGTSAVFEACRKNGVERIFYASSSSVYGNSFGILREGVDLNPQSNYAISKMTNEHQAAIHHNAYGGTLVGMRFFSVYGPWGRPDMAYWMFTKAMIEGKPVCVRGHSTRRDFTYVDDLVNMIMGLARNPMEGFNTIYNLGCGNDHTVQDMVLSIGRCLNVEPDILITELPEYEAALTRAETGKLESRIGKLKTPTPLDEGLARFVDWYKEYHK